MKRQIFLTIFIIARLTIALPINTCKAGADICNSTIQPRAGVQPVSKPPPRAPGPHSKPVNVSPVQKKVTGNGLSNGNGKIELNSHTTSQVKDTGYGHAISNGKTNGKGNGKGKGSSFSNTAKFPPAEASAWTSQRGFVRTSNHASLAPSTRVTHLSNGPQDRKYVKGPVSAFAGATGFSDGGGSSASGRGVAAAMMQNNPGTSGCIGCTLPGHYPVTVTSTSKGGPVQIVATNRQPHLGNIKITSPSPHCIDCTLPGQDPIRIETGPPGHPVRLRATNRNPEHGPIKVNVQQEGSGSNSAAASNRPDSG